MASIIVVVPKMNVIRSKQSQEFFNILDQFLESQGWLLFDNFPRTYFMLKNLAPTRVQEYINNIKNTKGYREAIKSIFYAPSLRKV